MSNVYMNKLDDRSFVLRARAKQHHWKGSGLLSIKSFDGEARYKTDAGMFLVDSGRFLIVNHAQEYEITIDSQTPVASFCIFFPSNFDAEVLRSMTNPPERLLDAPQAENGSGTRFFERTYLHDSVVSPVLTRFRAQYPLRKGEPNWLDEQLHLLMERMLAVQQAAYHEVDTLRGARAATREELYRRLYVAHDYIAACYDQPITLAVIAAVACLSPNHLLRNFRALFGQTPYQYLIDERLRRARWLLVNTEHPITEVCFAVGYESLGSFSWLFTRRYGFSPQAFRTLNR